MNKRCSYQKVFLLVTDAGKTPFWFAPPGYIIDYKHIDD